MPTLPMKIPWYANKKQRKALRWLKRNGLDRIGRKTIITQDYPVAESKEFEAMILSSPDRYGLVTIRFDGEYWPLAYHYTDLRPVLTARSNK